MTTLLTGARENPCFSPLSREFDATARRVPGQMVGWQDAIPPGGCVHGLEMSASGVVQARLKVYFIDEVPSRA
jgi:hypothetical protein